MRSVWLDVKYALRSMTGRPGFAALAVLTLALGIGVNTVAFSAINALLLRPLRMSDADRVGWITLAGPDNARGAASLADLDALTRSARSFSAVAAEGRLPVSLQTPAGAEQAWALAITANYLQTISATPVRGRLFTEADVAGSELPVVVSYRFWRDTLGAPDTLGSASIILNNRSFTVVGVLPDEFQGIGGLYAPDVWLPLARLDVLAVPGRLRSGTWLTLFGRLSDGTAAAAASAELTSLVGDRSGVKPPAEARTGRFYPVSQGHPELRQIGKAVWPAFGAVGTVLLIACFNVAALLLARSAERQKEISVRCAIGATRGRILRQLAVEGVILATISGAAALVVAAWSADLLATFSIPAPIPQRLHLGLDWMLVGFTMLLVVFAGVLPVVIPALQSTRANLLSSMRRETLLGSRPSRTRDVFVVVQIAGATLFVASALLFVRSFTNSVSADVGFDTERAMAVELSPSLYGYDVRRAREFFTTVQERLARVPGISHAAVGDRAPFYVGMPSTLVYATEGACAGEHCRRATSYGIGPQYFAALGVPLRAGREFSDADMRSGSAVIVSQQFARKNWPGENAIGRSLRVGEDQRRVEVVGVAADYTHRSVSEPAAEYLYVPLTDENYLQGLTVVAHARQDSRALLPLIREQVRAIDPQQPPGAIGTFAERMKVPQWMPRTAAGFFVICGSIALVLATTGLFGVMYFTVAQRTREFGVRTALGASRRTVVLLVLAEGTRLASVGLLLGITGACLVARLLSRSLFGVAPADPVSLGATALLQLAVALLACALPALRATRADPMTALRHD